MSKSEKKRQAYGPKGRRAIVRDWQPLFARLQETIEWALDIAVKLSRDYDEEIEAIERVREYLHGWLDGRSIDIDKRDLLTTLAILFAAIEIDPGIDSSALLAPLRTAPTMLHLPGVARGELPTVVIRMPRRWNAANAFTHLAAA